MIKLLDLLKEAFDNNNTIAYHRSRADFDKFDISKTESGFGGTLQGWGLYFSENPDVGPILYKVKFNVPAGKKWLDDYLTYDDLDLVFSTVLKPAQWYMLDARCIHSVEGMLNDRVSLQLGFMTTSIWVQQIFGEDLHG